MATRFVPPQLPRPSRFARVGQLGKLVSGRTGPAVARWKGRSRLERGTILALGAAGVVLLGLCVVRFVGDVVGLALVVALVAVLALLIIVITRAYKKPAGLAGVLGTAVAILVALLSLVTKQPQTTSGQGPTGAGAAPPAATSGSSSVITSYRVKNGEGSGDKVVVPGGTVTQPFQARSAVISQATVVAGCNPDHPQPCPEDGYFFGNVTVSILDSHQHVLKSVTARTRNNDDAVADFGSLQVQRGASYTLEVQNTTGKYTGFYFRDPIAGQAAATIHGAAEPADEGRLAKALAASVTGPPGN